MSEKPITFSPEMVRALGREMDPKRQTRRLRGLQRINLSPDSFCGPYWSDETGSFVFRRTGPWEEASAEPTYLPGDLLYVKEAWRTGSAFDHLPPPMVTENAVIKYLADNAQSRFGFVSGRYRPARFMRKWMARYWLRVLDVRPERVQDISEEDALAEGVDMAEGPHPDSEPSYVWGFRETWWKIHGHGAWERGDWIWRIAFERTGRSAA